MIAACLETIPDVPTELRDRLDACVAILIPPRNAAEARPLASAGEEVLRRLPTSLDGLPTGEAVATVRTTWLINGAQALDRLVHYASDPRPEVQDELVTGWNYFDPHEYAERVLADAPLHKGRLTVEDPGLLPGVPLLHHLRDLRVTLPESASLDCIQGLPGLTELRAAKVTAASFPALAGHTSLRGVSIMHIAGPVDDVSALFLLPKLRAFSAHSGQFVSDLSFIRRLPELVTLGLPGLAEVDDFSPLASQPALKKLLLYGCKNLKNIDDLNRLTGLQGLTLASASLPEGSMNQIVNTWPRLTHLETIDAGWVTSLEPISALPLEILSATVCPDLTDIAPIMDLHRLRWLSLFKSPVSDIRPVTALRRLKTLVLGGHDRVIDLTPISSLPRLRNLRLLAVTEDTDLSPLAGMRNLTISLQEGQHVRGMERVHRTTRIEWVNYE